MRRFVATLVVVGTAAVLPVSGGAGAGPVPAAADGCPQRIDEAAFASEEQLAEWNRVMADLGPRPTGSPAHEAFVSWLEGELAEIEGLDVTADTYEIDRWLATGSALTLDPEGTAEAVPTSGAVPYSEAGSVTGELVYVPPGTPISEADVAGKVVLRDVVPIVIPMPLFLFVSYYVHDPDASFDYLGDYARDWVDATELEEAAEGGAAGIVFAHEFPRDQVEGHYQPYAGRFFELPAAYVGVDEGERLKDAVGTTVELTVEAERTAGVPTRNIVATLPGRSPERIVLTSHTDGMNAVWDNGPIGILALAEYLASLPMDCRPRTIELGLSTAHLYTSRIGAGRYARQLDETYESVAFAVVLEHLGAEEFQPRPRDEGLPGRRLEATGASELLAVFVHESPVTLQAVSRSVVERDLRRTWILRGADAPELRFPPHHSYGGEGSAYHGQLIPTVAAITNPWTLFKPAFGQPELLDVELMRRQTMAFGDVILRLDDVPKPVIAGADTAYRVGRDAFGGQ